MARDRSETMKAWRPLPWFRREAFLFPLSLFVCGRLALLLSSYVGMTLVPQLYMHEQTRQELLRAHPALDGLCRWDCGWYERVAREGYIDPQSPNVFPLFPLLGHWIERTTGAHRIYGLLLVANLASFASYLCIYWLFRRLEGASAARWGLLLFAAYPFAYYQAAAYPESLMVLGSSLALLLAVRRKHLWAGLALGLGVLARQLTLFTGAGLLAAQIRARGWHPRRLVFHRSFLGLAIPFACLAGFALYLKRTFGDPLAFIHAREISWGKTVWNGVREIWRHEYFTVNPEHFFYSFIAMIPLFGTILLLTRKRWLELAATAAPLIAVVLTIGGVGLGRYSAACWPAFLPFGVWLARSTSLQGPVVAGFMLLQGIFFFLFSHQFAII